MSLCQVDWFNDWKGFEMREETSERTRRAFMRTAIISTAFLALPHDIAGKVEAIEKAEKEDDITPTEDLMREHGLLKRVLLVYWEALRRLESKQEFSPDTLKEAAGIIRSFIEDYHEKLEVDYLFPRFRTQF
jgi:hypothetical protein